MKFAMLNGERSEAILGCTGICEICNSEVISKCGEINIWHWSHKNIDDCDTWNSGETLWHINWKNNFPKNNQEVIVGKHRADVKLNNGLVIEFQASPISNIEIEERENFYKNMIWVIKLDKLENFQIRKSFSNNSYSFRWKYPKKSFFNSSKPIYIDLDFSDIILSCNKIREKIIENILNDNELSIYGKERLKLSIERIDLELSYFNKLDKNLFIIRKLYKNVPCGGWGTLISKQDFLSTK